MPHIEPSHYIFLKGECCTDLLKNVKNHLRDSASSFNWLSSSIFSYCRSVVPHRWHLLSSLLYDVSKHTNHIFSVRIWSWQHVSVNISSGAELSPVYCCLVIVWLPTIVLLLHGQCKILGSPGNGHSPKKRLFGFPAGEEGVVRFAYSSVLFGFCVHFFWVLVALAALYLPMVSEWVTADLKSSAQIVTFQTWDPSNIW